MRTLLPIGLAAAVLASCTAPQAVASPTPAPTATLTATASPRPTNAGLAAPIAAHLALERHWFTVPDALVSAPVSVSVQFDGDPAAGTPVARLRPGGREAALVAAGPRGLAASIDLRGIAPGAYAVDVVEHLAGGAEQVVASAPIVVSQPAYVVWTADFEGDAAADDALANTVAIADGLGIAMTIMWNPRVWTTPDVSPQRADAMLAWTKARAAKGDEVALHIHAWADYVRDAGVTPRTAPNWSGRSDGYDVPLTAFDESETRKLLDHAVTLMSAHGLAKPTTFRGGGLFANAANLRAIAAAGFTVDTSGTPAGGFGRLPLPWTLAKDAQPYRPSSTDANASGDLPLFEVPNIAGNTYGYTVTSIQGTIRDDLAMLGPQGQPVAARRVLTLVSHPATIDDAERAAIEKLFTSFDAYRYDKDSGPLRFVTMAQLAQVLK